MKEEKETRRRLSLDTSNCKSLREIVFETIRNAIIQGELKPGERLMEVQLASEMGVSRTPVRESIRKLELEGLVCMIPRKGAYVTHMSIKGLQEMMQIRRALEILVAELAAKNATEAEIEKMRKSNRGFEESAMKNDEEGIINYDVAFHETMYQSAKNDRLFQMIHSLREQMLRVRVEYVHNIDDKKPLIGQHESIVENIAKHDVKEAGRVAGYHIENAEADMMEVLE
ncbi:GntR family transcriptional regulator [Eubacterium aggregans]|uniref:GntR family transcriptional regulator n=1 Tax=Eubacterium aggregans TaxID=81409 RepID=UPI003F2BDD9C